MSHSGLAALRYTLRRIALFIASAALLYAVGMREILLWAGALLVSGALSLVWLRRDRDEMSEGLVGVFQRVNHKFEVAKSKEDQD